MSFKISSWLQTSKNKFCKTGHKILYWEYLSWKAPSFSKSGGCFDLGRGHLQDDATATLYIFEEKYSLKNTLLNVLQYEQAS